jgi:hypothetical protein
MTTSADIVDQINNVASKLAQDRLEYKTSILQACLASSDFESIKDKLTARSILVLHEDYKQLFTNKPSFVMFSALVDKGQIVVMNKPLISNVFDYNSALDIL